jgi:NADH dehydrogenase
MSALGADPQSSSLYARTNAQAEQAVREVIADAVVVRPSVVFGPEDDLFNRFAGMARLSPALPLIGGGATRFQPVYVGDVADAFLPMVETRQAAGRTYELGGPKIYSFREMMREMLRQIDRRRLLVPVPFPVASVLAAFAELLPGKPLTRDQVKLLRSDNVTTPGSLGLTDLGVVPTALEIVLPTYLDRFRLGGYYTRFERT